jgi:hypothetical protein
MSEDGVFGVATANTAGTAPGLLVVVRRDPAPTPADLVGEWLRLTWIRRPGALGGSRAYCSFVEVQITPGSVFSETAVPDYNDDGVINAGPPALSALHAVGVLPGGWISVDRGAFGTPMRGGLSSDGNVLLLGTVESGPAGVPGDAEVQLLLRRGLAIDTAEALGSVAVFGFQSSTSAFASLFGAGALAAPPGGASSLRANVDGSITPPFFPDLGVFVQVSGKAFVDLGSLDLRGAAGPLGGYVAAIGGLSNGDEPGLYLFVR